MLVFPLQLILHLEVVALRMLITEESKVINNLSFPAEANIMSSSVSYSVQLVVNIPVSSHPQICEIV